MMNGFRRMSGTLLASAALATASLLVPASAYAQSAYVPPCVISVRNLCFNNWQQGYESYAECVEILTEALCEPPPWEIPGPFSLTANRND